MPPGVTNDPGQEVETHRCERAFPQLAGRLALDDEAPVLRGDGARVHGVGEMIDRASRNRIAFQDRPFHCGDAAMPWQQRRMVADATQTRPSQRLPADPCVRVRGHDELGPVGDRIARHILGIFEQVDGHFGLLRRKRQPVIGGRRNHTRDFSAVVAQGFEHLGPEKTGPDQCALHRVKIVDTESKAPGGRNPMCARRSEVIIVFRLFRHAHVSSSATEMILAVPPVILGIKALGA